MSETRLIIDQMKLTYEGVFDLPGLYRLINSFYYERGWDWGEKINTEQILPTGRSIDIELTPFKNITDYYKNMVRIRISGDEIKRVEIEKDGAKIPLQEGKLKIVFDGYIRSDRYSRWEQKPLHWFLRTIFDKYVFKNHYAKAEQWLFSDVEDIYLRIKSFLNVYRSSRERGVIGPQYW
ncbi:hypothetical protein HY497_01580 [Candidatus Woesearchaeota archaeon]|nr:hypothetical protein [Candidatus Woesearchaeota archaeon]